MNDEGKEPLTFLLRHDGELTLEDSERLIGEMLACVNAGQVTRAAFRAFVELVQNIRLHAAGRGSVSVWIEQDALMIETSNSATDDDIRNVSELAAFANANADVLGDIIRTRRHEPGRDHSPGAGLGILETRRQCGRDLQVSKSGDHESKSVLVIRASLAHKSRL